MGDEKKRLFPLYKHIPFRIRIVVYTVVSVGIIIMIISSLTGPEIMGHLRGGRRLIVWPPGDDGKERQLSVYSEGNAFVGGTPERISDSETWHIERLIEQWCASSPEFRELAEDEPFYDVVLECENTRKRFKVPVEQFPPELVEIDERLEW
jgi:hypothetical protein